VILYTCVVNVCLCVHLCRRSEYFIDCSPCLAFSTYKLTSGIQGADSVREKASRSTLHDLAKSLPIHFHLKALNFAQTCFAVCRCTIQAFYLRALMYTRHNSYSTSTLSTHTPKYKHSAHHTPHRWILQPRCATERLSA